MMYCLIELDRDVENIVESVGNCMDWQTLIGNYAFPIACCLYLFWSQEKERERHKEESDKWVEALNNNTKVLEAIKERIGNG